jgi:uncharacterized MAPEG superfamily protein
MVGWILAALLLLFVQSLLPPAIRYMRNGRSILANFTYALGPRDVPMASVPAAERASRALANLMESLPIFLTLAVLVVVLEADGGMAQLGAAIYVLGRIVYVPCYVFGVYLMRSLVWALAGGGLLLLAIPVISAAPG